MLMYSMNGKTGDSPGRPVKIHSDQVSAQTTGGDDNKDNFQTVTMLRIPVNILCLYLIKTINCRTSFNAEVHAKKKSKTWNSMMESRRLPKKW